MGNVLHLHLFEQEEIFTFFGILEKHISQGVEFQHCIREGKQEVQVFSKSQRTTEGNERDVKLADFFVFYEQSEERTATYELGVCEEKRALFLGELLDDCKEHF